MLVEQQFKQRAEVVPKLGLGLSVDVYSPDVCELMNRFEGLAARPAYLEIFHATTTALQSVRRYLTSVPLTYHGEGLWITQPDFPTQPFLEQELTEVASQLHILGSPWLNHECATKQMSGYSFGTYLPPLYTVESANVVADNIALVQERLDQTRRPGEVFGPLFLLEMPPLTYFMAGTVSAPEYFRQVTERTACGLVLDIGHLWTVYRYGGAGRQFSLERFVERFLDEFPMERVIEIHIAGLSLHEAGPRVALHNGDPAWIDAHAAAIPAVSWMLLEQVLAHPRLTHLRGVALEVDTKSFELILDEFTHALAHVGPSVVRLMDRETWVAAGRPELSEVATGRRASEGDRRQLESEYLHYAKIASGQQSPSGPLWEAVVRDPSGLLRYVHDYLPYEILHWGGELTDMFPETCKGLNELGLSLQQFVPWWFERSRPVDRPYDFFALKIDRFVEFVAEHAPALAALARREADGLRQAYEDANAGSRYLTESCQ